MLSVQKSLLNSHSCLTMSELFHLIDKDSKGFITPSDLTTFFEQEQGSSDLDYVSIINFFNLQDTEEYQLILSDFEAGLLSFDDEEGPASPNQDLCYQDEYTKQVRLEAARSQLFDLFKTIDNITSSYKPFRFKSIWQELEGKTKCGKVGLAAV